MSQTFWTIIASVSIFVLGQIFITFVLKPLRDFYRVIGEISHKVKFHANVLTSSGIKKELVQWASGDMRDLSSQLESRYVLIPFGKILALLKILRTREEVRKAAEILIYLSNAAGQQGAEIKNSESLDKLKRYLKIDL